MLTTVTADAIRDYKDMSALSDLPDYARDTRMALELKFPYLAQPHEGEANRPYDTRYKTIKKRKVQLRDPIREMLRRILPNRLSWPEEERRLRRAEYGAGQPPEMYSRLVDSIARFIIGTLGGCALIVPMVVLSLGSSLTKSLIVVSVSLVLFALIVGLVFELDNKDTIVATATYAAVLVVFVGNSGDGNALAATAKT
jgi:VIT1/CCC1 family predicted Fe2+/Mn2+ transporter